MTVMNTVARSGLAAARDLRAMMQGKVALLGDDAYSRARRIWNGAVGHHPALFALCEVAEDLQTAVRAARARELQLSVRGRGHDLAGRAQRAGGLQLAQRAMTQVEHG